MTKAYPIILIGGGIASLSAIKAIRQHDTNIGILLISNEDRLPYKRTQINKTLQKGFATNEFALFPGEFYEPPTQIIFGNVTNIHRNDRKVVLEDGQIFNYDKLLIATGHTPRTPDLANIPSDRIFSIYTAQQAEMLLGHAANHASYFVVGGGVEGVEMAEQLVKMGKEVTLIHRSNLLMPSQLTTKASEMLHAVLVENGVKTVHLPHPETHLSFKNNQVELNIGDKKQTANAIVSCIGSSPNISLAVKAQLQTDKGIVVDRNFRTSDPTIFAAGTAAQLQVDWECYLWHHAEAQGYCAGLNMIGVDTAYTAKPFRLKTEVFGQFFFSLNYQRNHLTDNPTIENNGTVYRELFFDNNQIKAVVMVNDKERAKAYQSAVWERWDREKLMDQLPISH